MSNPAKANLKTEWFPLLLILLSLALSAYFYQHFPARVPTHWNFRGEVNGYSSRAVAAFLSPAFLAGLYLLFWFLPYLDPRREQYAVFAGAYHGFKELLLAFLFVVFALAGLAGLGYSVDMNFWVPLLIGVLFGVMGWLLAQIKTNWFIGIRTPWTLSSPAVWEKTHRAAGPVFTLAGALMAAVAFLPAGAKAAVLIISLAVLILALPVYSYILYAQENKKP